MKLRNGILLSLLISLTVGCSSTGDKLTSYSESNSTTSSVQSTYQPNNSYVSVLVNFTKWHWYRLPDADRQAQEQAMYFALDNVESGDSTSWYNNETGTNGTVIVFVLKSISFNKSLQFHVKNPLKCTKPEFAVNGI